MWSQRILEVKLKFTYEPHLASSRQKLVKLTFKVDMNTIRFNLDKKSSWGTYRVDVCVYT